MSDFEDGPAAAVLAEAEAVLAGARAEVAIAVVTKFNGRAVAELDTDELHELWTAAGTAFFEAYRMIREDFED